MVLTWNMSQNHGINMIYIIKSQKYFEHVTMVFLEIQ